MKHWSLLQRLQTVHAYGRRLDARVDQVGDGTVHVYHHFRCTAVAPVERHATLFQELMEARGT